MIYMDGKDLAAVSDSFLAFWYKLACLAIFFDLFEHYFRL